MHALTLLIALAASQTGTPEPVDMAEYKDTLHVATDGKQHYVAWHSKKPYSGPLFYGDGKTFHKMTVRGGGSMGKESFEAYFWEPRTLAIRNSGDFAKKEGQYWVTCGEKRTEFKMLTDDEARALTDKATFLSPRWTRLPERLLRDETGRYFFVDRLRTANHGDRRDFRVFMGKRGKMKVLPLKDVVDDSEGMIFSTKTGELRLVADKSDEKNAALKWVEGKKQHELINVPLDDNRNIVLVYLGLGVYDGERLGTPCDDLM